MSVEGQPINAVRWVPRESLSANGWNPNNVFKPEMKLLKLSILEDGWTQPIVVTPDDEIVDGFHRWTISSDPDVYAQTGGLVPVVTLTGADAAHLRMSTVRHNRARGSHHVLKMADLMAELCDQLGVEPEEAMRRLGMEAEEVKRLRERGAMPKRGAADDFGKGWVPGALKDQGLADATRERLAKR